MASNEGSSGGSVSSSVPSGDVGPLWQYVTRLERTSDVGGTWRFQCSFCDEIRFGTYSRVRAHLLQLKGHGIVLCKKVPSDARKEMAKLDEDFETSKKNAKPKQVPLPSQTTTTNASLSNKRPRSSTQSPLERAFDVDSRTQLDQEIARMFYTGGLPFNLARNPYYMSSYTFAANHNLGGYVPPGYNKLRTTLLNQERANVDRLLQPLKSVWPERGVTIVTDGWSDPQRKPLINFMVTSGSGPMFLKAVNCFGETKDKIFISNLMKEVIDEVGHKNVVQVITDNAANCKGAGEIIEGIYPHIYWTPCVVHTLNLALKNICAPRQSNANDETFSECSWIIDVYDDALAVKHYIMNHNMRLSMFNRFSSLKLLSVADTRFASIIVMLKRMKLIRRALETMVISEEWASYREDDVGKAAFVKEKVMDDLWWEKINYILAFTGPIYDMIRFCDTDKPSLHLVYEMWDGMIEKVKVEIFKKEGRSLFDRSPFFEKVYNILVARWTKSNTPLHCLAHSLNPRFYSKAWLDEDLSRVPPHKDDEISQERGKCFRRLFPNDDDYSKVLDEYCEFSLHMGSFSDPSSMTQRLSNNPKSWWANFGSQTPLLQGLALRLLGQPTSSSSCERNWSTYNFIHSLRRNKLSPKRAEDLVFIHNNLRLLSRNSEQYEAEKTKMWDVGGDAFDSLDDTGFLEFANLSLDEPELESVFFNDNA